MMRARLTLGGSFARSCSGTNKECASISREQEFIKREAALDDSLGGKAFWTTVAEGEVALDGMLTGMTLMTAEEGKYSG